MPDLASRKIVITGASRGIGRAIALRAAHDGAQIGIWAKTDKPHDTLEGTIHTVADEIREGGGQAYAHAVDIRDEEAVRDAARATADHLGGIDMLVNNASAIHLSDIATTPMSRYDLMHAVNERGTFTCIQACLDALKSSDDGRILTMAPPLNLDPGWLGFAPAYMLSKYGMALATLAAAEDLGEHGITANTLWPATTIATAAIRVHFPDIYRASRTPDIVADATYRLLTDPARPTGQSYVDEAVLRESGVTDFDHYAVDEAQNPTRDFFLDTHERGHQGG